MVSKADEITQFWEGLGPAAWYKSDPKLDASIRERFLPDWEVAHSGGHRDWLATRRGALAYLILTDQFPRNMFRDDPRAFATDTRARTAAIFAVDRGFDLKTPEPMRQFFYMPFMHAESTFDQDRCVCLMLARMPETGAGNLPHARVHREIIRRFGRFPYRNAALGRANTPFEDAFLTGGGYGAILQELA